MIESTIYTSTGIVIPIFNKGYMMDALLCFHDRINMKTNKTCHKSFGRIHHDKMGKTKN